ncbi:hypothetical protein C7M84_019156 [Penaeus vannamei]|uniref:Activator of basal transcription 1 n=1 Tax=Penaeus vannamei TaxID=6689 RepID=A0A3R7QC25_PENVA|nr:hypothetical protein C7M84_019156 [Penaeus vannamei]
MVDADAPQASTADTTLSDEDLEPPTKRRKPGIIYLSIIPPNMNVADVRDYFSNFGEVDRMFLQAGNEEKKKTEKWKKKKRQRYTEGWIEFKSKRKAKAVQLLLNNQPVRGKRRNPYYDMLWNIKYLPRDLSTRERFTGNAWQQKSPKFDVKLTISLRPQRSARNKRRRKRP